MSLRDLVVATASTSIILARGFIILLLGKLVTDWSGVRRAVIGALLTYIMVMAVTVVLSLLMFSASTARTLVFPTFTIIRSIEIGQFIQNIDIIFIGIWIMGMFATTTGTWYISLLSLQQALRLSSYRFLIAPTALILGISSITMAENILEVQILSNIIIPFLYGLALFLIPLVIFLLVLFKPEASNQPAKSITVQNLD
jgi:hypothetical protein